jgi:hypothetical protein
MEAGVEWKFIAHLTHVFLPTSRAGFAIKINRDAPLSDLAE